jgi:uncharacterized membrane protein (DUF373 family)
VSSSQYFWFPVPLKAPPVAERACRGSKKAARFPVSPITLTVLPVVPRTISDPAGSPVLNELKMALLDEIKAGRDRWQRLTVYLKFEHAVVLVLTGLLSLIIISAVWKLALKVVSSLVLSDTFDLTDLAVFQSVFGMIFTVIIALEFKRTLLVVSDRTKNVVQVRAVILIALLAVVRKLIILDIQPGDAPQLWALAAATLALGGVYWLVRDQDRRESS